MLPADMRSPQTGRFGMVLFPPVGILVESPSVAGVEVAIESDELPKQLKERMADILKEKWMQVVREGRSFSSGLSRNGMI